MKTKKTVAMVVILMGLLGVFAPGASAAQAWYTCTVNNLGLGFGACYINLTDTAAAPAFTNTWFTVTPTYYKEFLAISLTAMTNDMPVLVFLETTEYSVLSVMYIQK